MMWNEDLEKPIETRERALCPFRKKTTEEEVDRGGVSKIVTEEFLSCSYDCMIV